MYSVRDFPIDNRLETVDHGLSLMDVLETMFERDFTQIGVERDGELVGVVTYRSVVRTMLAIHRLDVNDRDLDRLSISAAVQEVTFVDADESILALFDVLAEHTYAVLERDEYHIVTDHDLITALEDAIEPFLLIETIERRLRDLFREEFGDDLTSALKETFDEDHPLPTPRSVEHCSFGHYTQFVSIHWDRFEEVFDDHQDVVRELLRSVGDVRNRLFHFRVADPEEFDLDLLRFGHSYVTSL